MVCVFLPGLGCGDRTKDTSRGGGERGRARARRGGLIGFYSLDGGSSTLQVGRWGRRVGVSYSRRCWGGGGHGYRRREHRLTQLTFIDRNRQQREGVFCCCWWRSSETGRRWRCFTTRTRVGSALIKTCSLGTGQCTSLTNCAAGDRWVVLAVH